MIYAGSVLPVKPSITHLSNKASDASCSAYSLPGMRFLLVGPTSKNVVSG